MRHVTTHLGLGLALALSLGAIGCRSGFERDDHLAGRIRVELEDGGLDDVSVSVDQRVAVLAGVVANDDERARAEQAVRKVPGVLAIEDRLVVAQPVTLSNATVDSRLAAQIQSRLASAGLARLRASAEGGAIVIAGPLPAARRAEAMRLVAESTPPAWRIVDRTTTD